MLVVPTWFPLSCTGSKIIMYSQIISNFSKSRAGIPQTGLLTPKTCKLFFAVKALCYQRGDWKTISSTFIYWKYYSA